MSRRAALCVLLLFTGCGDDGGAADASASCAREADCDDGLFCNGAEVCSPGAAGADARGCLAGIDPCPIGCSEAGDECLDACPDADRDGFASVDCGGADCDDGDDQRYPGNIEICDAEGRDEDCDPTTFGPDDDGDGFVAIECCNQQRDGSLRCGRDCNDRSRAIAPGAVDTCGNGDEDCDGDIDEDPGRTLYRDLDGDGQGTRDDTILGCAAGSGYVLLGDDCDDADDRRSPDFEEMCDSADPGRDENCDGLVNPGCPCVPGVGVRVCGATDVGECGLGSQSCVVVDGDVMNARWGECVGERTARTELCNGLDDDCDGSVDESFECVSGTVATGTNACGRDGSRTCNDASCTWETLDFARTESVATCDYCDDTGVGVAENLATDTSSVSLRDADDEVVFLGDARETVRLMIDRPDEEWCSISGSTMAHYICLADPNHYGGVSLGPYTLGYDGITVDAPVGEGGDVGFAVSLVEPGSGDLLGPGGAALGVPLAREGLAVEWRGYNPADISSARPTLTVRRMGAAANRILATIPNPRRLPAEDAQLRVVLAPDVSLSVENETRLEVATLTSTGWDVAWECGPSTTPCSFAIAAGTPMDVSLSASVLPGRTGAASFRNDRVAYLDRDFVSVEGLCPP